jgi:hypothetical protein
VVAIERSATMLPYASVGSFAVGTATVRVNQDQIGVRSAHVGPISTVGYYHRRSAMRYLLRSVARMFNRMIQALACSTYGEVAELHDGPCGRCVGRAVEDCKATHKGGR